MTPRIRSSVSTKLSEARKAKGVSQQALASALGLSRDTYARLELGTMANPPIGYLVNAAIQLGCRPDALFEAEHLSWQKLTVKTPDEAIDPRLLWKLSLPTSTAVDDDNRDVP